MVQIWNLDINANMKERDTTFTQFLTGHRRSKTHTKRIGKGNKSYRYCGKKDTRTRCVIVVYDRQIEW